MKIVRPVIVTDAVLAASSISEDDYPEWVASTTYAAGDQVMIAASHIAYEAVQGANTGHDPTTDTTNTWWVPIGTTNRWRMFDYSPSQQSAYGSQLSVTLVPGERIDTVALMNVSAASVTITQTDAIAGVVYGPTTHSLVSTSGIADWYAYFFEPVVRLTDFAMSSLLPYANSRVTVTLDDPGEMVLCGECSIGLSREIGSTQYGAKLGIRDYSQKVVDAYGNYSISPRRFAKTAVFAISIPGDMVSEVHGLLAGYRTWPIVYIGSDDYAASIVYGFYKDFSVTIAYRDESICSLTVEGLT